MHLRALRHSQKMRCSVARGLTMTQTLKSPKINHISWGRMDIEALGTGKDFKLYPGGGRAWDWNETDTHHVPGIQPADVEELLAHGSKIIVLSRGMELALQTAPETVALLKEREILFHIEETKAAVTLYNQLVLLETRLGDCSTRPAKGAEQR